MPALPHFMPDFGHAKEIIPHPLIYAYMEGLPVRKEDINKYTTTAMRIPSQHTEGEFTKSAGATAKTMGGMVWKIFKTVFWVAAITGLLVFLSVASYILSFRNSEPPDINSASLNYSSHIYVRDDSGADQEYYTIFRNEDRVWTSLRDIPDYMKTAQIAIEDHRFYQHRGVDWKGTLGAVYHLLTGQQGRGGSTLTQQLIKNITKDNSYSVMRKVREIFTALNLEKDKATKDQILESYLNIVNYGGMCQGVEAAAQCYFEKSITECDLAECALIAGITQNPYQYNPLIFPEQSKEKATLVLDRMLELTKSGELDTDHLVPITQAQHDEAVQELQSMDFVGAEVEEEDNESNQDEQKWNWYIDYMFNQVRDDLMEKYGYSADYAVTMIYNGGLEIYSAMDQKLQSDLERYFLTNTDMLPYDEDVDLGFFMMDPYDGRVMATIGSRYERDGVRLYSNASDATRQCGSSMKGVGPYAVGIGSGAITYGTVLKDQPLPNYFDDGTAGPRNWNGKYSQFMCVDTAIEMSMNAPAVQLANQVTPQAIYDWLTQSLHFDSLIPDDNALAPMALGGLSWGVTVEEMTAGYQIYANGGVYHKPASYYYVKDHQGNVILDNRDGMANGEQVMSPEKATIMNKLLHKPIYGTQATGGYLADLPVEIYGKTGTTDDDFDLYFVGATPFCVAGIWNGYDYNRELGDGLMHLRTWYSVMQHLIENYDWSGKEWVLSDNVYADTFCRSSGKIAGPSCFDTATGWYESGNAPSTCNGGSDHIAGPSPSPSVSPSVAPSVVPSVVPSVAPSVEPSVEPTQEPSDEPTAEPTDEPPPTFNPIPTDEPTVEPTQEPSSSDEPVSSDIPDHTPDVPVG